MTVSKSPESWNDLNFSARGLRLSYVDAGGDGHPFLARHAHWMEASTFTPRRISTLSVPVVLIGNSPGGAKAYQYTGRHTEAVPAMTSTSVALVP